MIELGRLRRTARADGRGNVRIDGPGAVGNLLTGNRIGTDLAAPGRSTPSRAGPAGNPDFPADGTPSGGERNTFDPRNDGVVIAGGASGNSIGGLRPGRGEPDLRQPDRRLRPARSAGNVLVGNRIGTNASGASAVPNGDGVIVLNSSGNTIGGLGPAARNVISGNLEIGRPADQPRLRRPPGPGRRQRRRGKLHRHQCRGHRRRPEPPGGVRLRRARTAGSAWAPSPTPTAAATCSRATSRSASKSSTPTRSTPDRRHRRRPDDRPRSPRPSAPSPPATSWPATGSAPTRPAPPGCRTTRASSSATPRATPWSTTSSAATSRWG